MQRFLSRLFRHLMKSWNWVLLILLTILIKWASWYPEWVEINYTYGLYPMISKTQRLLLGWIPFSAGDLFYGFLVLVLLFRAVQLVRVLLRRQFNRKYLQNGLQQLIFLFLFVYVFFNLLWGLNYNRTGISAQLQLKVGAYTSQDVDTLTSLLHQRLNSFAATVTPAQRDSFRRKRDLFHETTEAYTRVASHYPFLAYKFRAVKPSLFSYAGNYLGFQGYYNPFSGEAQVNTTIPQFLQPFVTSHEMAHQLGYARENEANFVGFLACRYSESPVLLYSMYYDMFNYAIRELYQSDTSRAGTLLRDLHPQVKKDRDEYRRFYQRHRNPVESVVMWGYGHYLKANNQPAGKETYDEVVAWLIAYYKKFGADAI